MQELLTDAFTGAAERHIEVGDGLDMLIIHKDDGVRWVHLRESCGRCWECIGIKSSRFEIVCAALKQD